MQVRCTCLQSMKCFKVSTIHEMLQGWQENIVFSLFLYKQPIPTKTLFSVSSFYLLWKKWVWSTTELHDPNFALPACPFHTITAPIASKVTVYKPKTCPWAVPKRLAIWVLKSILWATKAVDVEARYARVAAFVHLDARNFYSSTHTQGLFDELVENLRTAHDTFW